MTDSRATSEGAVRPRRLFALRNVSPALFVAILIAFALPFGTVSCEGPPVTFNGYELATWRVQQTTPPATTDDGESLPEAIESGASWMALLVLLSAVAGLAVGLAGRRGAGFAVVAGVCGTGGLWLRVYNFRGLAEQEVGFELVTCFFLLLAVWHAVLAKRRAGAPSNRLSQGT